MVTIDVTYDGGDLETILDFDYTRIAEIVVEEVLREEKCPYPAEVNLLIMSPEEIHAINKSERGIDRTTDVLSFPMVQYLTPAAFPEAERERADSFDPETGNLMLGDILINVEKVREQAEEYGHSRRREFAFLVAHSMLHLIGYDHMEADEEKVMFAKQENVLAACGITREERESE